MKADKWGTLVMTVEEVIAELKKMPHDALVYHEGCDCIGEASSVTLEYDGTVLIHRS